MSSGKRHTDDYLKKVADLYRQAMADGKPVQATVADALGISLSTATKQIMQARRRGMLNEQWDEYLDKTVVITLSKPITRQVTAKDRDGNLYILVPVKA